MSHAATGDCGVSGNTGVRNRSYTLPLKRPFIFIG